MRKTCVKKTFYYKLARNARSCVGVEGFTTFFRTLAISISVNGIPLFKKNERKDRS